MGHLEAAVRILAMLARGGCSVFEERSQTLLQVGLVFRTVSEVSGACYIANSPSLIFGCIDV